MRSVLRTESGGLEVVWRWFEISFSSSLPSYCLVNGPRCLPGPAPYRLLNSGGSSSGSIVSTSPRCGIAPSSSVRCGEVGASSVQFIFRPGLEINLSKSQSAANSEHLLGRFQSLGT